MSSPNHVPAAFRRLPASGPSYIGWTDDEVLAVAASALKTVQALPYGTDEREGYWHDFNHAMGELTRRAVNHTLAKIYEIHEREHRQEHEQGDGR
jgi:hypothetical protein